jgi:hypothetical protein
MADEGDPDLILYPSEQGPKPEPQPPRRSPLGLAAGLLALVVVVAAAYYLWSRPRPAAQPPVRPAAPATALPSPVERLPAEPGENIPLPPLDQTDPLVRQLVGRLSSHPDVAAWLATDQLIRNFAQVTATIAGGGTPARHLGKLPRPAPFRPARESNRLYLDAADYHRYDGYADAVAGLDASGTARVYATLKPRIQDAYRELGYPAGDFDQVLEKAIVELLSTPIVDGPVRLERGTRTYTFADPRLEALSPAQRQFLRMGPRNQRLVAAKLREIAVRLGIPPSHLPTERVIQAS